MLLKKLKKYNIILGSKSPRRKKLLEDMGIDFCIKISATNETINHELDYEDIALDIAKQKAKNLSKYIQKNSILITADTIILLKNKILEKPKNKQEAFKMLKDLSMKTHKVITGVYITSKKKQFHFTESTQVTFKKLHEYEINYYIDKYNPFDKAGGYGIQEWIGKIGIKKITGSYSNVLGLPLCTLYSKLIEF